MRNVLIGALLLMAAGCTKDYNLQGNGSKQLYVIEGRISNLQGPYYVRITMSEGLSGQPTGGLDNAEAVKDALVIISDDMGMVDTLVPADWRVSRVSPPYTGDRGYYQTTKITGSPGHTYHLQVRTGNETFQASAYMPYVTTLDSIELRNSIPVTDTNVHPSQTAYAYFKEPQSEENYYLLQLNTAYDSTYDNARGYFSVAGIFPFYVFDDKTLPPYVNGMAVGAILANGVDNGGFVPYPVVPYDDVEVRLCSLTREAYEYFVTIEKQFQVDGNVYKPAPASASGNISGGALGLFWATSISYKVRLY